MTERRLWASSVPPGELKVNGGAATLALRKESPFPLMYFMNAFMNAVFSLRTVAAAAAVALLVTAAGCGTAPSKDKAKQPLATAVKTTAADVLLADAMQRQTVERSAASALLLVEGAAQKAPNRADIAWLQIALCTQVAGCRPEALESRLRKLDPGNGVVWIGPLARARRAGDTAAENEILEALSRSQRIDIYWNSLVSKIAVARGEDANIEPTMALAGPLTNNLNEAIGWLSAVALPAFQPVTESCSGARIANPAAAARCLGVAQAMQRGDTYIAEGIGLGIAQQLAAPGSPQAIVVDEQIELSRYQRDLAGQIMTDQIERERFSHELVKLMNSLHREQDVFIALIRWAGQPVTPPAG